MQIYNLLLFNIRVLIQISFIGLFKSFVLPFSLFDKLSNIVIALNTI